MTNCYFIKVETYRSVNSMGLEIGKFMDTNYNHTVVETKDFHLVVSTIKEMLRVLEKEHPKCKPFRTKLTEHKDRYGNTCQDFYIEKEDYSYVAYIQTDCIRNSCLVQQKIV